ncbi:MAG: hypothetical protein Q8O54_11745 [Brevundimonas sp.]|nr:hypothetical protein [Brevundimonas sp.]
MTSFQIGAFCLMMTAVFVAWWQGGHTERLGAATVLIWAMGTIATPVWLHKPVLGIYLFEAVLELAVLVVFIHMALKSHRWWPFAAVAVMTLSVMVYYVQAFVPELDRRAQISAHVGLGIALYLTILAGVGERWLAGERPVSENTVWRRPRRAT